MFTRLYDTDALSPAARRVLVDEHAVLIKSNLPTSAIAVSLIAGLLWLHGSSPWLPFGLGLFFVTIGLAVIDLYRPGDLDVGGVEKLTVRSNLLGGLGFGQFTILAMPRETEAQLLFAVFVLATLGVNVIEAQKVPASFLAFHLPFSASASLGYVLFASGTARWSTWFIILGTLYFPILARTGFKAAAQAAELTVNNGLLIDQLRGLNERLAHQSTHDQLTGLANRAALDHYLSGLFAPGEATPRSEVPGSEVPGSEVPGSEVGALFVDLDRFKDINDTLGHQAGDELLTIVARRLAELVDDSMFLGRFGGDEMIIIVPDGGEVAAKSLAESVVATLASSVVLNGQKCDIGASVGVATVSPTEASASDLVRFADMALYVAKACGRGQFAIYTPEMSAKPTARQAEREVRSRSPSGQTVTDEAPTTTQDVSCS